jgi:hypothetical protein
MWIDRSADHSCRYCIGLLRRGGLCSERDAQRRRGHALRSSTAVRLWPGLQRQDVRVCHDGRLATGRIPGRSAQCRDAVRRDKRVGAGAQRDPVVLRTDGRRLAVGEPRRYTGAAAVHQRGTRMSFRTGLSPVVRKRDRPTRSSWVAPGTAGSGGTGPGGRGGVIQTAAPGLGPLEVASPLSPHPSGRRPRQFDAPGSGEAERRQRAKL